MAANLMSYFQKGFEDGLQNYNDIQNKAIARAAAQLGLNELHDAYLIKSHLIPERHLQAKTEIEADTIDNLYRAKSTVATMPYKDAHTISNAQNAIGQNALDTDIRNSTWNLQMANAQAREQAGIAQNNLAAYDNSDKLGIAQATQPQRYGAAVRDANSNYYLSGVGEIGAAANYDTVRRNPTAVQEISDNALGNTQLQSRTEGVQAQTGLLDAEAQAAARVINQQIAMMDDNAQQVYLGKILLSGVYNEKQKQAAAQVLAGIKEKQEQARIELLKAQGKEGKSLEQIAQERSTLARIELFPTEVAAELGYAIVQKPEGGFVVKSPDYVVNVQEDNGTIRQEKRSGYTQEVKDIAQIKALLARGLGLTSEANEKIEQYYHRPQNDMSFGFGGLGGVIYPSAGGGNGGSQ